MEWDVFDLSDVEIAQPSQNMKGLGPRQFIRIAEHIERSVMSTPSRQ